MREDVPGRSYCRWDTGRAEDEEDGRTGGDSPRPSFRVQKVPVCYLVGSDTVSRGRNQFVTTNWVTRNKDEQTVEIVRHGCIQGSEGRLEAGALALPLSLPRQPPSSTFLFLPPVDARRALIEVEWVYRRVERRRLCPLELVIAGVLTNPTARMCEIANWAHIPSSSTGYPPTLVEDTFGRA